jgi:hypothetical protein
MRQLIATDFYSAESAIRFQRVRAEHRNIRGLSPLIAIENKALLIKHSE